MNPKVVSTSRLLFTAGDTFFLLGYVIYFFRTGIFRECKGFSPETLFFTAASMLLRYYRVLYELPTLTQFLGQSQTASPNILNTLWVAFVSQKTSTFALQLLTILCTVAAIYIMVLSRFLRGRKLQNREPLHYITLGLCLAIVTGLYLKLNPSLVISHETTILLSYLMETVILLPQLRLLVKYGPSETGILSPVLFVACLLSHHISYLLAWSYTGQLSQTWVDVFEMRISADHCFRVSIVISVVTSVLIYGPYLASYAIQRSQIFALFVPLIIPVAAYLYQAAPISFDNYFLYRHLTLLQACQFVIMTLLGGSPFIGLILVALFVMQKLSGTML